MRRIVNSILNFTGSQYKDARTCEMCSLPPCCAIGFSMWMLPHGDDRQDILLMPTFGPKGKWDFKFKNTHKTVQAHKHSGLFVKCNEPENQMIGKSWRQ